MDFQKIAIYDTINFYFGNSYTNIYLLFDLQIGSKISTSIVSTTDDIITAEREAVGMNAKCGVKKEHAAITSAPVTIPPKGVWTPLALQN